MTWNSPHLELLYQAIDPTWAPLRIYEKNSWLIRKGGGGGRRVSAATPLNLNSSVEDAEQAMQELNQDFLFMIRGTNPILEVQLAHRRYSIINLTILMTVEAKKLAKTNPGVDIFLNPSPALKILWNAGGINENRLAVMGRVKVPKAYICIKQMAGAFAAIHNDICMVHALEVLEGERNQGLGKEIMQAAAYWAIRNNAKTLVTLTAQNNNPAIRLFHSLGMAKVGTYHYRLKKSVN